MNEHILKGLEAYSHEQEVIKRILRRHGNLSTSEFDRIFTERKRIRRAKVHAITPETYIIGGLMPSQWSIYLDLMQHMALAGLVKIETNDNEIYYSL